MTDFREPTGGVGGIADTCAFYRSLFIPVAVIADLDIITDLKRLMVTLETLTSDPGTLAKARAEAVAVLDALRKLNPQIAPQDLQTALHDIATQPMEWGAGHDHAVRKSLNSLAARLDRLRRLKHGGIDALPVPLPTLFSALTSTLAESGLFLVPVGELEGWLADKGLKSSRGRKWAWANEAAEMLRKLPPEPKDIWGFIRGISSYLRAALG